ncbi:hypothetical protein FQZ97_889750 [compost metagenome]
MMLLPGNSLRNWSMPKKMVRFSMPSITLRFPSARTRGRSCGLGSNTKSTSPESNAAMRVATAFTGV